MVVDRGGLHMQAAHLEADAAQASRPGVDEHESVPQESLGRPQRTEPAQTTNIEHT